MLCVCSDKTVGRKSLDEAEDLSVSEFAFPVTSDPNAIKTFLKGTGPKVIFSTYQSSELVEQAQRGRNIPAFDLVVADEAHRCAGNVEGAFSVVLDGKRIRASKRLFTTATPRTYTTHLTKNAADRGIEIVGMDDPVVFGPELHHLTFGQAIHNVPPLLTDYQVVIIGVDQPMIAQWIEEGELVATNPDMATDARSLAAKIGLIKAIKDYGLVPV